MKNTDYYLSQNLDVAFKHLKISSLAVLVNILALSVFLYDSFDNNILESWFIFSFVVLVLRFVSARYYESHKNLYQVKTWENVFMVGVVLGALTWAFAGIYLFDENNFLNQSMLLFIIAGISAGSIASLSSHYKSIKLFLVISLVPLIIKVLLLQDTIHFYFALLMTLFLFMLLKTAQIFNANQMMYLESQKDLMLSKNRLEGLIETAPVGIFSYDENLKLLDVNQEFSTMLDASFGDLVGLDMNTLQDKRIIPSIKVPYEGTNGFYEGQYISTLKSLEKYVRIYTSPIYDEENKISSALAIILDITDRVQVEKEFEYQAKYDSLTNIPNRYTLMDRLTQEIARFKRYKVYFAVVFIDLDHFKDINDSFGHSIGDELIIELSSRLQKSIRNCDMVARLGGDEFVLLLPDLSIDEHDAAVKVEMILKKINLYLQDSFNISSFSFNVTASMGVALSNFSDESADDILKHADMAMYSAKKDGRNLNRFYEKTMDEYIHRRLEIENDLKGAIKEDEFELYFQPIVDVASLKVIGVEALLRWTKHLDMSPEVFIPIAEDSGLILPIGNFVLEKAMESFMNWKKLGLQIDKIAINISLNQFVEPNFVKNLQEMIEKYKIDPQAIELEFTESIIIKDVHATKLKMQEINALGIGMSIDDFGTGYSSLSYLKNLPFSTLKIDKSFTADVLVDEDDKELVSTIIMIAQNLNLQVVVEGVEEEVQLSYISNKKADYYQGYYCSKPLNNADFLKFMELYK